MIEKKIILIGINFNSSNFLETYLNNWKKVSPITHIIVVDNYFSEKENKKVIALCNQWKAKCLCLKNVGYGAALNHAILYALTNIVKNNYDNFILFVGNIDVLPIKICIDGISDIDIPEITIFQNNRNRNPFLNTHQGHFLFLPCLAAKYKSKHLLMIWRFISKFLEFIPGKTHSVHGSLFVITGHQANNLYPIFNDKVFLYCEELFFSRKIRENGYIFKKCNIIIDHIGSISTSKTIKKDRKRHFDTWIQSMSEYCR